MKTLAFGRGSSTDKSYLVLIHTSATPAPDEWHAYVAQVSSLLAEGPRLFHSFVATDGGGPNAAQRKELAYAIEAGPGDLLTHVFTTDSLIRGIVTAFSWITKSRAVAHLPGEFTKICIQCGVSPAAVMNDLLDVQQGFPVVNMLTRILDSRASERVRHPG